LSAFRARATDEGRPGPGCSAGTAGFGGFFVVVVVVGVVVVDVVVELLLVEDDEDVPVPVVLPWVTTNVTARMSAPRAAMIAGRGSSMRGALGTVRSSRGLNAFSARRTPSLRGSVAARVEACHQSGLLLSSR